MDNQKFEERLSKLEDEVAKLVSRLSFLDRRTIRATEMTDLDILKVELRVKELEARVGDLGDLERIAQEAYLKTTPEAQAALYEVIDAVDVARSRLYFSNLPAVKDHERRSKS